MRPELPRLPGILTAGRGRRRPRPRSRPCRSPTAPSRGRPGSTPTSGTTSRPRWRCSSAARSRPRERAYDWALTTQRADGSWPMKIVAGRGRGRQRRDQHVGVPRGRRLAPLAGPPRPRRSCDRLLADRAPRRSTSWSAMQLPFGGIAWSQEWRDGRPGHGQPGRAAGRLVEHLPVAARRGRARRAGRTSRSPSGSWPGGRLGHALREHRDLFLDKSARSRWTGTTRCSAARCAARPGRALIAEPLGRLRGARAGHPLRRHQPVGDRRRDLRAGAGPGRPRRPRARAAGCSPTCSTCATTDGRYWTGCVFPESVNWPVEHTTYTAAAVILAADALARDHAGVGHHARARTLAADFPELGLECGCASADGSADGSPASPCTRRSTRIEPSASHLDEVAGPERPQVDRRTAAGRRRRGRGTRRGSPAGRRLHPAAPSRGSRAWRGSSRVPAVDEQQRQRRAPAAPTPWSRRRRRPRPGPRARRARCVRRKNGSVSISPSSGSTSVGSWCSQPAWFSSEPRWWSTVNDGAADLAGRGAEVDRRLAAVGADLEHRPVRQPLAGHPVQQQALVLGHEALGRPGVGEQVGGHARLGWRSGTGAPPGWRGARRGTGRWRAPRARSGSTGRCRRRAGRRAARRTPRCAGRSRAAGRRRAAPGPPARGSRWSPWMTKKSGASSVIRSSGDAASNTSGSSAQVLPTTCGAEEAVAHQQIALRSPVEPAKS